MTAVKQIIVDAVDDRKSELTAIAAELFHNPETGLGEFKTSALLSDKLAVSGFRIERGISGMATAFRAAWGTGSPAIAILAEMDALPALGQACGHNIIAAAAIGAALALRQALPEDAATIVVLGTPAEELGIGKFELIRHGAFDRVDFAMMVHPSSRRQVIKMSLGLARIRFTFLGRAAHASAYPEEGINALDAVLLTFNGINALRQQLRQDVRVHGIITEGGTAPNLVPERASCYFYVRAEESAELLRALERVKNCARGAAEATGCGLEMDADERVLAPMKVNRAFSALYSEQLAFLGLNEAHAPADRNRGSSDIGNVSQVVPTIHPHVPIGPGLHIHTEAFARATVSPQGQEAVVEGAKALALTAAALASSAETREKILNEFRLF
ncbi:M20 family metallopeptidase [Geotalea sp. SG265]|uniref:M20 family metallopeptidase n=1 Tax=Geotalea sp. SG265 TaxID=2922867 RepID=UPI001FAFEF2F|nr:M20 family metallopeptidase [Geotalea sp. SG265]